jgi:hypothetical protein
MSDTPLLLATSTHRIASGEIEVEYMSTFKRTGYFIAGMGKLAWNCVRHPNEEARIVHHPDGHVTIERILPRKRPRQMLDSALTCYTTYTIEK